MNLSENSRYGVKNQSKLDIVHAAIDASFSRHLDRCRRFLQQKSISATGEGIRETALIVEKWIQDLGGDVRCCGDPSFPIVYGRLNGKSDKTLIIYGMYDVQPAEEKNWRSPPFEAEVHSIPGAGDCIIARGAVNSKGALCGLFNALEAIQAADQIPLNLIFTIEGEEEIGSPNFKSFISEHRDQLKAEGVVDFDFSQDSRGDVAMHLGLKGIVYMDLTCHGGRKGGPAAGSVHGSVSAWISSPVWRLLHALSSLTDNKENIRIPYFYENVTLPDTHDMALLKTLEKTFDEKMFLKEMKSMCFKHDRHGIDLLKRGLYMPVININGFQAGYAGPGTKTLLPKKAVAKIDIRFGPNMEPEEVIDKFKAYLLEQGFDDISVTVRDAYSWSKTSVSAPIAQHMISSYRHHGIEPQVWPMAIWAAPYFTFSRILDLPVVSGGLGQGGRAHVANEYMSVSGLKTFEKFVATFLYTVAETP